MFRIQENIMFKLSKHRIHHSNKWVCQLFNYCVSFCHSQLDIRGQHTFQISFGSLTAIVIFDHRAEIIWKGCGRVWCERLSNLRTNRITISHFQDKKYRHFICWKDKHMYTFHLFPSKRSFSWYRHYLCQGSGCL